MVQMIYRGWLEKRSPLESILSPGLVACPEPEEGGGGCVCVCKCGVRGVEVARRAGQVPGGAGREAGRQAGSRGPISTRQQQHIVNAPGVNIETETPCRRALSNPGPCSTLHPETLSLLLQLLHQKSWTCCFCSHTLPLSSLRLQYNTHWLFLTGKIFIVNSVLSFIYCLYTAELGGGPDREQGLNPQAASSRAA